MFYKLIRYS